MAVSLLPLCIAQERRRVCACVYVCVPCPRTHERATVRLDQGGKVCVCVCVCLCLCG